MIGVSIPNHRLFECVCKQLEDWGVISLDEVPESAFDLETRLRMYEKLQEIKVGREEKEEVQQGRCINSL